MKDNEHRIDPKKAMATRWADYWIMDLDGSNKKRLTWFNEPGHPEYLPGQTHAAVVSWCPDGTRLFGLHRHQRQACGASDRTGVALTRLFPFAPFFNVKNFEA